MPKLKNLLPFFGTTLSLLMLASAANAATFLQPFSGNTRPTNTVGSNTQNGTINFAVIQDWNDGSLAGFLATFTAGTGSPINPITSATGKYLYLYQIVNDGPTVGTTKDVAFHRFSIAVVPSRVQSYGSFGTGFVLKDDGGEAGSPLANAFGSDIAFSGLNNTPAVVGVVDPSVAARVNAPVPNTPTSSDLIDDVGFNFIGAGIVPGERSVIVGFVSDSPPGFDAGNLIDGATASGLVPVPLAVPEPATIALCGIAGVFFGGARIRRMCRGGQ